LHGEHGEEGTEEAARTPTERKRRDYFPIFALFANFCSVSVSGKQDEPEFEQEQTEFNREGKTIRWMRPWTRESKRGKTKYASVVFADACGDLTKRQERRPTQIEI